MEKAVCGGTPIIPASHNLRRSGKRNREAQSRRPCRMPWELFSPRAIRKGSPRSGKPEPGQVRLLITRIGDRVRVLTVTETSIEGVENFVLEKARNNFRLNVSPSLTEVLVAEKSPQVVVEGVDNVEVLISGSLPPSPSELLRSPRRKNLILEL